MQKMTEGTAASRQTWDTLETFARVQVRDFIRQLLEDEVTEWLGREKSARRAPVDAPRGARNGQGKSRRLALMNGTITVRRPRVRDLEARFVSRLLPLFQRRPPEVGAACAPPMWTFPHLPGRIRTAEFERPAYDQACPARCGYDTCTGDCSTVTCSGGTGGTPLCRYYIK